MDEKVWLIKYFERAPLFVYCADHNSPNMQIVLNARLNRYEFFKVKDCQTAYQELSMYLGNQARPEKPIPKIDDKTMSEIKGFDKFSFRKEKSKK